MINITETYLSKIQNISETTALVIAAYMAYKRYLSKAGQICKGTKGNSKTMCILKTGLKASEVAKDQAMRNMRTCSAITDVKRKKQCLQKYQKDIAKWESKVEKMKKNANNRGMTKRTTLSNTL